MPACTASRRPSGKMDNETRRTLEPHCADYPCAAIVVAGCCDASSTYSVPSRMVTPLKSIPLCSPLRFRMMSTRLPVNRSNSAMAPDRASGNESFLIVLKRGDSPPSFANRRSPDSSLRLLALISPGNPFGTPLAVSDRLSMRLLRRDSGTGVIVSPPTSCGCAGALPACIASPKPSVNMENDARRPHGASPRRLNVRRSVPLVPSYRKRVGTAERPATLGCPHCPHRPRRNKRSDQRWNRASVNCKGHRQIQAASLLVELVWFSGIGTDPPKSVTPVRTRNSRKRAQIGT